MKYLSTILVILLLLHSCQTKQGQRNSLKSVVGQCDELDIVYYTKDTFAFETIDTTRINFYKELVILNNENYNVSCEPTGQLIYRNKGKVIFVADLSIKEIKDSISCEFVSYFIDHRWYRHRLTYRHGMGIDEIYWRKVDPKGNPTPVGVDTTKNKYVSYKNKR